MRIPPQLKIVTNFIYDKCAKDIGSMLIWTTIVGWVASSTAQIIGIAKNPNYTKEQKSFMIPQELGDAAINIGSFFLITAPIKKVATKLVSTGKILPAVVKEAVINNGDGARIGKLDFDLTKASYFTAEKISKPYNSFHNFMSTSAAVVGGIISSNIVTPILRNRFASGKQSKMMIKLDAMDNDNSIQPSIQPTVKPAVIPKASPFNTFKTHGMSV